ncbi:MAG TPA: hypothetical protein VGG03_16550 [Thermoanaerobaculia bacterium]|jgi:hypothetical protein
MKKRLKKLTLSRETLRLLEEQALGLVAGDGNTASECACSYTNCSEVCFQNNGC